MKEFQGQIALVTGASRGIGRAIAIKLAERGAHVYINYLKNQAGASATLDTIRQLGGAGEVLPFDVSKVVQVNEAVERIAQAGKGVQILVNNAGVMNNGFLFRLKAEQVEEIVATNIWGTYYCCKAVLKQMVGQRYGRIINLASIVGETGNTAQTGYGLSKAAIIGFSKSLAREVAPRNITVNVISPGFIETDMTGSLSIEERDKIQKQIPLNRFGTPEDVAAVAAFLAGSAAAYITGEVLRVNGGLLM